MKVNLLNRWSRIGGACALALLALISDANARDVDYNKQEIAVWVNPGEPTQIAFPGKVAGGFMRKGSSISLDKKETDLIVFANERIAASGEAIIVRLDDGRSYSLRVQRATAESPRDDVVRIEDSSTGAPVDEEDDGRIAREPGQFEKAPPTHVAGLMREMVLASEFGKNSIAGYRVTDRYKGQSVLKDGTVEATIDKIFIGPDLWGYVLDAKNMLDQTQKLNPASFRIDGTRAISAENWELAPRPLNIEEQISGRHNTKVYIVTRSR